MGKKKGKKGKSQGIEEESTQQPGTSQQQPGPPAQQQQQTARQGGQGEGRPQQRGPPDQPSQPIHPGQQRGPSDQQRQRGPSGQQQGLPGPQPQQGPSGQQPQQGAPSQRQRGPPGQQQGLPGPQPQRGPPGQQQGLPGPQPQPGPPGLQPQQGPPGQRQWGPPGQQPPPSYGGQQPQQGPPGQQQRGPPGLQPQQGPPGQQPQVGHPAQHSRGRPGFQPQQSPPGFQPQQSPPDQQPQQVLRGQQPQRGRGRGRGRGAHVGQPQVSSGHPQQSPPPQHSPSPQPSVSSRAPSTEGSEASVRSELGGLQLSRVESGQGDSKLVPMESKVLIKPGTKGRKIFLETNHVSLNLGNLTTAIHYDVSLDPDLPKKLLRHVLEVFRLKHYPNRYPAFDGRKNLYSASLLPFGQGPFGDEIVVIDPEGGREKRFKVEIKFANKVDLTPLRDLLKSRETPREAMQVVDIVLRSAPAATCISVGRSFFVKPPRVLDLGQGMEMYNGFYQSAIRGWKPFLNVDVAHKSFPKNINLLEALVELLDSYYQPFKMEDLSRPLDNYQERTLSTFIKTLKVSYEIPGHPSSRRVYRVNGIDVPSRNKTFKLESGEQLTVAQYFERSKNYRLRYPHLPTLWVGSQKGQIFVPLELCTLIEGQVLNRKMNENQTSKMIKFAATSTDVRKDKIMTALNQAKHNIHPCVKNEFGFSIGNTFEKIEGRVLKPPALGYEGNRPVNPSKGVWRNEKFFNGMTINKWTIVCADRRPARPNDLGYLAETICKNASSCGMSITAQAEKPFVAIGNTIQDIRKYFETQRDKKYDVIFVVVPNSGPQYSYVKTAAEINVGCLTQCIKQKTLGKINAQTVTNILLKVNSKLNGTNHFLLSRPPIMNKPCMIMGADVTHPSPDAREIPSVAAVTASHDPKAFQYNICWRLQPPKVEIIEDLERIVVEQLEFFYKKTRCKPERIIFFRDGVSEGQFDQVRHAEIRAIRSACKKLQASGYEPAITFLVVQKRHHTRLFPTNPRDSEDRNNNVPAGTCVDTTITHPFMQDFYLVSHASIQGVAKPTKYCTLWDDNSMSNDDIEELTYYLCHMFTRCNRSVSYPAPTYYAHLAAARAKVYIENERLNMENLQREFTRFQIKDAIRKDLPMFFV